MYHRVLMTSSFSFPPSLYRFIETLQLMLIHLVYKPIIRPGIVRGRLVTRAGTRH